VCVYVCCVCMCVCVCCVCMYVCVVRVYVCCTCVCCVYVCVLLCVYLCVCPLYMNGEMKYCIKLAVLDLKRRVCVMGLHCCGDLSPAVLNYFINSSLTSVHSVILFGCCYHKMSTSCTSLNTVQTICNCVTNMWLLRCYLKKILLIWS